MAENKKSFLLYCDLNKTVTKLPDEVAGKLFKTILSYVNDENPCVDDLLLQIAFEPIKQQLKRDLQKYEGKKRQWSNAGKKSAEKRSTKSTDVNGRSTDSTVTVNDSVTVNVNDNVKVIDTVTLKENLIEVYFKDLENSIDFENICRNLKIEHDFLKTFIPAFRLKAELKYPTFDRFTSHFKNYVLKELTNATNKTGQHTRNSKQESVSNMEKVLQGVLAANNSDNRQGGD